MATPKTKKIATQTVPGAGVCGTCYHFEVDKHRKGEGFCYRHPPQVVEYDYETLSVVAVRPSVKIDDKACGDFSLSPTVLN